MIGGKELRIENLEGRIKSHREKERRTKILDARCSIFDARDMQVSHISKLASFGVLYGNNIKIVREN